MNLPGLNVVSDASDAATTFFVDGARVGRREFVGHAQAIAQQLSGRAGSAINLSSCRYRFTLGFAAALQAGLVNLLPPNRQPSTIAKVLDRYPDSLVLHDTGLESELLHELQQRDIATVDLRTLPVASEVTHWDIDSVSQEQLAAIVFTSGSTGEPSAIPKYWKTLAATTAMLRDRFIATDRASVVATVPPQHMYGLETTVLMGLLGVCSVSAAHPFFPADIAQVLVSVPAPRILVTTPIHLKALLQSNVQLPALDTIISATAPLAVRVAAQAEKQWSCRVKEIYGCSEAGSLASRHTAIDTDWRMLEGAKLRLTEAGVEVTAPHLAEAVLLQDELEVLTAERFRFLGRSADMLNIAGKRGSLAELSAQLQAIAGVSDGIFFLREDGKGGVQRLAALVVSELPRAEIVTALARMIDPAFMPRPLKKVSAIPRNAVGKIPHEQLLQVLRTADIDEA